MAKVDHYMVEHLDSFGEVQFANDNDLTSLTLAKALARRVSKSDTDGAYVVAFAVDPDSNSDRPTFVAVGHISFFDGRQSETDGVVL